MANPCCPQCKSTSFAITEINVAGAQYKHNAIHCSKCGAILSIHEYFNIGVLIHKLADKLRVKLD